MTFRKISRLYSTDSLFVVGNSEFPSGQTDYGYDNPGSAGSFSMNPSANNQQSYGYAGPASTYSNVLVRIVIF